eukprot:TRINITY_DN30698_c0_g1_i1.p2 TRINITY_DN30698_c0_g1~~TRINITY_DN30698_c0_g1_i1.p2  ORF type:complete len:125 (-),score=25.22 TRINITY_DN30698_c0_g1_i1:30-404(-)
MYYRDAKAALIIYDITQYDTFRNAKNWIKGLHETANPSILIAFVGNKIDLEDNRQVLAIEAKEFCEQNGLFFFEVSAKKNINIQELFLSLAKQLPVGTNYHNGNIQLQNEKQQEVVNSKCPGCL